MTFRTIQQQVLESTRPKVYICRDSNSDLTHKIEAVTWNQAVLEAARWLDAAMEMPRRTIAVRNLHTGEERTYCVESETARNYTARQV